MRTDNSAPRICWYFNTDESEDEGKNAYAKMINHSCIAAWGHCLGKGTQRLLRRPAGEDMIFLYRAGHGIVASGQVTEEGPFKSRAVFDQRGEYHRRVVNLRVLPGNKPLSYSEVAGGTGYFLPVRCIICRIHNSAARSGEYVIHKEHASAFAGTPLAGHLLGRRVDTLLITGCSTSACVRATATDAKSLELRPMIVREAVGDRSEIAHEWTLFDIQARFADVVSLTETLGLLQGLSS